MKLCPRRTFLAVCTLLALVAITVSPAAAFDDKDRTAIRAAADAWLKAAVARDAKGLAAMYTADAVLLPPNAEAITGRDAIGAFFTAFPPFKDAKVSQVECEGHGDIAFARGTYSMTILIDDKTSIPEKGKFLEVWRKQADGSWKIARDMFSSDMAMPGGGHDHDAHKGHGH